MTEESRHSDKEETDYQHIFDQFPAEEQDRIRKIWDASERAGSRQPDIPRAEVEHVLSEVHKRIAVNDHDSSETVISNNWRWLLAAAVLLVAFGIGFLFVPQTVTAPRGEITSVTLPDGSTIELNSGTEIQYNRLYSFLNRTVHLDGEAFFSVRSRSLPFVVKGNDSEIKVTGTKFNIRSWSSDPKTETEVAVSEGAVQFYPEGQEQLSVTVTKGQLSSWTTDLGKPQSPQTVSVDQVLDWRKRELVFNEKSLLYIFRELERRFDVDIRLESEEMKDEILTTFYSDPQDIEAILQDICRVKGLRYAKTADGYRIFK